MPTPKTYNDRFKRDPRNGDYLTTAEEKIDGLIHSGLFDEAKAKLNNELARSSRDMVRLMGKLICLPFYEIGWNDNNATATTPELLEDAETIHADTVALLAALVDKHSAPGLSKREYGETIGNISEVVILAMGAREFNKNGELYITPGSYTDNHALLHASDLHLSYRDRTIPSRRLQIKTRRTKVNERRYASNVIVVGINDLDNTYYDMPSAENSVHSQLTKELSGTLSHHSEISLNKKFDALMRRIKL